MTLSTIDSVVTKFLSTTKPEVLAIKGAWGVGKTFAWRKLILKNRDVVALDNYCYVSLFGISSLAELRMAIFTQTESVKRLDKKLDAQTINEEWFSLLSEKSKKAYKQLRKIKEAPYLKQLAIGLDAIAPHLIQSTVICLDDFERLSDQFKTEELLGYISSLKEEKACKIVIIFNEEKLCEKQEIYKKYREKVIDIEVLYSPSPEEAADLALPISIPHRDRIKKHCISLEIRNIRILKKIIDLAELIHPKIEKLHIGVTEQAFATLVLFAWIYYDTSEHKPSIEFVKAWNSFSFGLNKDKAKQDEQEKQLWANLLNKYEFTLVDEFDLSILKVIESGHIEETGLIEQAKRLDEQLRAYDLQNSFSEAWGFFHYTFKNNEDQLIEALSAGIKKSFAHISPSNLNATVKLLRQLDRNDLASELVDFYIENRKSETELFNLQDYPFASEINDSELIKKFTVAYAVKVELPTLQEAVDRIASKSGWSKFEVSALSQASEDDYFNLFMMDHGKNLPRVISICLDFEKRPGHEDIGRKARSALARIGNECRLNQLRVARYIEQ